MSKLIGFRALAFAAAILAGQTLAQTALAQVEPVGTFQEIFVTQGTTTAASTGIGAYNSYVAAQAALNSSLPGATWTAVASTASNAAYLNAPSGSYPVYNTDGQLVSVGNSIYSGSLANAFGYDQFGNANNSAPWTGSNANGTGNPGFTMGSTNVIVGNSNASSGSWINDTTGIGASDTTLYGLSSPITNTSAVAGGGPTVLGGVGVSFTDIGAAGVFSSALNEPTSPASLETVLGTAAYNAINFTYPGTPILPGNPITPSQQVWDLEFSGTSTGLNTVTLHFDSASIDPSYDSELTIKHFTGGSWVSLPGSPVFNFTNSTVTFETASFSPFTIVLAPEPSTVVLLGIGLLGFAAAAVRTRRSRRLR